MNRQAYHRLSMALLFFVFAYNTFGQVSKGGTPLSISSKISTSIPALEVAKPDWDKIREEDSKGLGSIRFAVPIPVHVTPQTDGVWTDLPNGGKLWQLKIKSKDALGLAVSFNNFALPEGAKLYMYSPDYKQVYGAYEASENPVSKQLLVGLTKGDETVIEYYEPKNVRKKIDFTINNVYHAYNQNLFAADGFGTSEPCEININCPQGATLQNQKRGVVRIRLVLQEGLGWCSGSLVNNTSQDGKPYILSAYHCADGYTPNFNLWTFYFNYESASCTNPATEPTAQSLQGCVARTGNDQTDFILFELNQRIPTNFNAYFNGWNRDSTNLTTKSNMIHHPNGDIKKISLDNDAPTVSSASITWTGGVTTVTPPRSHLIYDPDQGTSEGGSSGAPIFDANGRIIAQNHGGFIDPNDKCNVINLLGGWLAKSWDGKGTTQSRLKDWLDPINSGVLILDGTNTPTPTTATVAGKVSLWNGTALSNVKVYIGTDSTTTDNNGNFSFSNIPLSIELSVSLSKEDSYENGLDVGDIVRTRRHIIGITEFDSPYKTYCADVDNNREIDLLDYILLKRLVIGINTNFPNTTAWRFVSQQTSTNPAFPFGITEPSPVKVTFTNNVTNFNFFGYKKGDVDGSVQIRQ